KRGRHKFDSGHSGLPPPVSHEYRLRRKRLPKERQFAKIAALETAMSPFKEWESFYVIVGSSAAALTGLQFVVMALINERMAPTSTRGIDAFGTPTVVHFGVAFLVPAILTASWATASGLVLLLAIVGALGVIYSFVVARRARQQTEYKPVFEDWAFHAVLPAAAYGVIAAAAYVVRTDTSR